ncbi:hypothetical protein ACMA5I_06670 [Paracoccaceae bacterium GXU_MW_L88]
MAGLWAYALHSNWDRADELPHGWWVLPAISVTCLIYMGGFLKLIGVLL